MPVNRMRHGNFLHEGQALYILETHLAGYAVLATNEVEKAADIEVLEFRAVGAFGRVYLGGDEASIEAARRPGRPGRCGWPGERGLTRGPPPRQALLHWSNACLTS